MAGDRPTAHRPTLQARLAQAERRNAELALIADMAGELARSLDIHAVASVIARTAVELTGAAECALWLCPDHGDVQMLASAAGIPGAVLPPVVRRELLLEALAGQAPLIVPAQPVAGDAGTGAYVALPLHFEAAVLGALDLVGFPHPEHLAEELATLQQALPIAVLSLQNALTLEENVAIATRLREALAALQQKQQLLEAQNEEIQAQTEELSTQNEEIQAQAEELRAQNEALAEHQRELAAKNAAVERANRELARLYEVSRQQEARMRAIIEATADGLMVVDEQQRVVAVNPALEAITGFGHADLVGRTCKYLLATHTPEGQLICDTTCPFIHPAGLCPRSVDARVVTRDGRQVWVNVAYGVIYGPHGRPETVVHAVRDISARKELERQKDEFLSIVAHDLRNPLTAIKGHAQLLSHRARQEENRQDDLKRLQAIDAQVGRMVDLIGRLLDLTRIQMGRLELQLEPTDLVDLAQRVVEQAQLTTDRHQLLLAVEVGSLVGTWDRMYVERILVNLVDNALKYSPAGGQIRVNLQGAIATDGGGSWPGGLAPCPPAGLPQWVVVSVADQGPGIAPEDQARLFERYYRAAGTQHRVRGLGLGLYITKGLVEAHGGQVWVESALGQGATFGCALPLGAGSRDSG